MFNMLIKFIIFLLALIGAATVALLVFVAVRNPLNIRSTMMPIVTSYLQNRQQDMTATTSTQATDAENLATSSTPILLSAEQKQVLEKFGIDTAKLPTEISPEMEECFTQKLGQARVDEIKKGETPNVIDLFKAKGCL